MGLERDWMGVAMVRHQKRPALRLRGHRLRWLGGGKFNTTLGGLVGRGLSHTDATDVVIGLVDRCDVEVNRICRQQLFREDGLSGCVR